MDQKHSSERQKNFVVMDHKRLLVWQKSVDLVERVYHLTQSFPKEEMYGIVSQIRRAAVSVPSNVAEGCNRETPRVAIKFMHYSLGSLMELETQLIISQRVGYWDASDDLYDLISDVRNLLFGTIRKLTELQSQKERA